MNTGSGLGRGCPTCGRCDTPLPMKRRTIAAGEHYTLVGRSGCTIRVGDGEATTLYADTVCTIEGGVLGCELL